MFHVDGRAARRRAGGDRDARDDRNARDDTTACEVGAGQFRTCGSPTVAASLDASFDGGRWDAGRLPSFRCRARRAVPRASPKNSGPARHRPSGSIATRLPLGDRRWSERRLRPSSRHGAAKDRRARATGHCDRRHRSPRRTTAMCPESMRRVAETKPSTTFPAAVSRRASQERTGFVNFPTRARKNR